MEHCVLKPNHFRPQHPSHLLVTQELKCSIDEQSKQAYVIKNFAWGIQSKKLFFIGHTSSIFYMKWSLNGKVLYNYQVLYIRGSYKTLLTLSSVPGRLIAFND